MNTIRSSLIALATLALSTPCAVAAGDVTAKVKKGDLILKGDFQSNLISVEPFGGGLIAVYGLAGTTVNGQPWITAAVSDDIKIKLKGGDDLVYVLGVTADDLLIKSGAGDDVVYVQDCLLGDDAKILTGGGHDSSYLLASDVAGDLKVRTGWGDDYVGLGNVNVGDDADIRTKSGFDLVQISLSTFDDDVEIDLGSGDDSLEIYNFTTFADRVELDGASEYDIVVIDVPGGLAAADFDLDDFEEVYG